MCKITPAQRIKRIPSLEELQSEIYKETLEHMVDALQTNKNNTTVFSIARDFDSYLSDDDEFEVYDVLDEIIDKIANDN
tara:strand:- start:763 stop:999 length:237 start_codon:yes stop_codon:yes gene_type:complete